jgi:hypothetical protein
MMATLVHAEPRRATDVAHKTGLLILARETALPHADSMYGESA